MQRAPARRRLRMRVTYRRSLAFALCLSLVLATGCARPGRGAGDARTRRAGVSPTGVASYYADKFQGRPTASGEKFDQRKMTAAHRTLAFGTKVRVTDVATGKTVTVRVNDRGPFVAGRVIDLSRAAAEKLGIVRAGLARVRIEVLTSPTAVAGGRYK